MKEKILSEILNSFVKSSDFNGLHLHSIQDKYDLALPEFQNILTKLIQEEKITLVFASVSINPYIKLVQDLSIKEQIDRHHEEGPNSICAYPRLGLLQENIDFSSYKSRPFTKRLVLAEPQLLPVFFNLDVLERYYRDPRYSFEFMIFPVQLGYPQIITNLKKLQIVIKYFFSHLELGMIATKIEL